MSLCPFRTRQIRRIRRRRLRFLHLHRPHLRSLGLLSDEFLLLLLQPLLFDVALGRLNEFPLRVSGFPLPARLEAAGEFEAGEDVGFGVDDDGVEGEEGGGGEEEVEVFEGFGLVGLVSGEVGQWWLAWGVQVRTSQKLSMLSLNNGGISLALDRLVNPAPSSAAVYLTNDLNISQPHSRYISLPVIRHM